MFSAMKLSILLVLTTIVTLDGVCGHLFRMRRTLKYCNNDQLEMVQTVMERVCFVCHELQSHVEPNTLVECHKDCFKNEVFRSCIKLLSGKPPTNATPLAEPTAPIPLYTGENNSLDELKGKQLEKQSRSDFDVL